jgi:hypothetical protein
VLELISRLAGLFWEALDRVEYAVALARCWAVDRNHGREPQTPAHKLREAEHEKLRELFSMISLDGTIADGGAADADGDQRDGRCLSSGSTPPRPEATADRSVRWCPAFDVTGLPRVSVSAFRSHTLSLSIRQKIERMQSEPLTQRDMMRRHGPDPRLRRCLRLCAAIRSGLARAGDRDDLDCDEG